MEFFEDWGLTLAIFLPLVGAMIMMAFPKSEEGLHKMIALGTSLIVAAIGVVLLFGFEYGRADELQWDVTIDWIDIISTQYAIGVDGISVPLLMLTFLITCLLYTSPSPRDRGRSRMPSSA